MTQTPNYVLNKNVFAWAVDTAWDFKKDLFDCIAGFRQITERDKTKIQNLKNKISMIAASSKTSTEKDAAFLYLARTAIFCIEHPDSPQTKSFIDLWKSVYLLFPNNKRPLDSVQAFKCLLAVNEIFQSQKAQYYIMHAFVHNTEFARPDEYKRAVTLMANNINATVPDLWIVLDERYDIDEKIAFAIIEKCYAKVVELENKPAEFRNNRPSGNKEFPTRHAYQINSICADGIRATNIMMNINPKYAMEKKKFFNEAIKRAAEQSKPKVVMPDINDLSQFPR